MDAEKGRSSAVSMIQDSGMTSQTMLPNVSRPKILHQIFLEAKTICIVFSSGYKLLLDRNRFLIVNIREKIWRSKGLAWVPHIRLSYSRICYPLRTLPLKFLELWLFGDDNPALGSFSTPRILPFSSLFGSLEEGSCSPSFGKHR